LDTGDQAGFALGDAFLVLWFLPIADTLLLVGTIGFAPPPTKSESRLLRGIATACLVAGGAFFLAYRVWSAAIQGSPRLPVAPGPSLPESLGSGMYMATWLALALTMFVCGLAVRPGSESPRDGGPPWLLGAILGILAIVILPVVAFIATGGLKMYVAQPQLLPQLLFMAFPALVWVATLLWSAWLLHHRRTAARTIAPMEVRVS